MKGEEISMSKLVNKLYDMSDSIGNVASKINNIESLSKGPSFFIKRCIRRKVGKTGWKMINKINRHFK